MWDLNPGFQGCEADTLSTRPPLPFIVIGIGVNVDIDIVICFVNLCNDTETVGFMCFLLKNLFYAPGLMVQVKWAYYCVLFVKKTFT